MTVSSPDPAFLSLSDALVRIGFRGEVELDSALRAAMSTDNSVYRIFPDLVVAPCDADDVVKLMRVLETAEYRCVPLTVRGGGTGTNGQSLNRGIILDTRRHMNRLLAVDPAGEWADVEPGMVLDDLNERLRAHGVFFAPETSTSTRCTIGGMVSTDASGKGSRIYGKTSDNLLGIEIARGAGLLSSMDSVPVWARSMLAEAEAAVQAGREVFIASTPRLNRRYTGYDLDRALTAQGRFEWWRLFFGSEGTLGPITRIRVRLRPRPRYKRLIVAGFADFRHSLAAATPLLAANPTAIEVMDERIQMLAEEAGMLTALPATLRPGDGEALAYTFIEFNGDDAAMIGDQIDDCLRRLAVLAGIRATHVSQTAAEISQLWAIRSAAVGLLGKIEGRARPVAFIEDCVVPPENLPQFLDEFLDILCRHDLDFGIYGHVDVGCLHIRPALDLDMANDRQKLVEISDSIFALVNRHGGIFWGEHGKGIRGAYLEGWIGKETYRALQRVKAAFDPDERFNPGKLVSNGIPLMGIATTPFRTFNSPAGDALDKAFRCNGNAQCLSYAAATPMCPSFKVTKDVRHSPKGRADALRAWHEGRRDGGQAVDEKDLLAVLDTCLGCKACTSSCPVQVDIPTMRAAFLADYYDRQSRDLSDRLVLFAERFSSWMVRAATLLRPIWPALRRIAERTTGTVDMPKDVARRPPRQARIAIQDLAVRPLPQRAVLVWMDWFSALFDGQTLSDMRRGLEVLGYTPLFVDMSPAGKLAADRGATAQFTMMADRLEAALKAGAKRGVPMIGLDPAFVMALRQDYPTRGYKLPAVLLPQEFLAREAAQGMAFPKLAGGKISLFLHCTERTGYPKAAQDWEVVFAALGLELTVPATGCCGMAGLYGHMERHQAASRQLFDMSWSDPFDRAEVAVATGFSCRCQAERLKSRRVRHPLGLIADLSDACIA